MEALRVAMLGVKSVPAPGGIARYVEELGTHLAARGHEVTVYCRPHYLDDAACGPYRGIRRKRAWGLRGKYLDAPTHTLSSAFSGAIGHFDILHVHGLAPGFVTPLIRMISHKRVVLTVHAWDFRGAKWGRVASRCMERAGGVALRLSHAVTAVSRGLVEALELERGCKATYTPPGIRLPELVPPTELQQHGIEPGRYVLCVSRLMPEKGVHLLVEAFRRLAGDYQLVIAGDCPYRSEYVTRLKAAADERVLFMGYVTGRLLEELYSNALVYVQPSQLEGLSLAVLEALSYGRPVLASDIPQNLEALGGHGATFRSGDVDSLSTELGQLLAERGGRNGVCTQARQYVAQEYDWEQTTTTFESVYEQCLSCRSRQGGA